MTEAEFIDRAHRRYVERAALDYETARACAEALWDGGKAAEDLDIETPESMVDEDLTYWTDDGESS